VLNTSDKNLLMFNFLKHPDLCCIMFNYYNTGVVGGVGVGVGVGGGGGGDEEEERREGQHLIYPNDAALRSGRVRPPPNESQDVTHNAIALWCTQTPETEAAGRRRITVYQYPWHLQNDACSAESSTPVFHTSREFWSRVSVS
jgi:hypothetical protein